MLKLELGATYCDWDKTRGDYINVYLDGEFVVELEPVRGVEASPGDQDAVTRETLATALGWAFKAGQARQEVFTDPPEPWEEIYVGQICTSCGTSYEQCSQDIAAHNNAGCCGFCRDYERNDAHTVSVIAADKLGG